MKILLGSNSPRRKELLKNLGYDFEVVSIDCDEVFPENLAPEKVAPFLSILKAENYKTLLENEILITADTIVVIENEILGKPKDKTEAIEMLKKLSAKTHQVYTAISVKIHEEIITKTDVASVEFLQISDEEISNYIENFEPYDKAGGYGIQDWIGMAKISKITGSFYTIMGFPTHLIFQILEEKKSLL